MRLQALPATGEVVTGTSERLATGDAVNVAARFEQAAAPGEVLIGEATHALVGEAVVAEPVEPLTLRGKSEPVPAYQARLGAGCAGAQPRIAVRRARVGGRRRSWRRGNARRRGVVSW